MAEIRTCDRKSQVQRPITITPPIEPPGGGVSIKCRPRPEGCRGLSDVTGSNHVFAACFWPCTRGFEFDRHQGRGISVFAAPDIQFRVRIMAVVSDYSCDFTLFNYFSKLNREILKSNRKSNRNVSHRIFTFQIESPRWFKSRFKSQSRWRFSHHCKYVVVSYTLYTGYVTQPNFARKNRLTMVMRISTLPLIFIAALWKFYTDRQNHLCFLNVLWYENWP